VGIEHFTRETNNIVLYEKQRQAKWHSGNIKKRVNAASIEKETSSHVLLQCRGFHASDGIPTEFERPMTALPALLATK
jgi:hypothetical protein